jgi:mRNA interferase MazF
MARILRGDILWAGLDPVRGTDQAGQRPALAGAEPQRLQRAVGNRHRGGLGEPRAGFPLTLELDCPKLPRRSWAKISQVRTLSTQRLKRRLAGARPEDVARIIEGLNETVGALP